MSFTLSVKNEIIDTIEERVEKYSFLSSIIRNSIHSETNIKIVTEHLNLANKLYDIIENIYSIHPNITVRKGYNYKKNYLYIIELKENVKRILQDTGIYDKKLLNIPKNYIIADEEQLKSYLKGLFLISGSINDPKKSRYHLEFVVDNKEYSDFISQQLNTYNLNSKSLKRESKYMIYIKESERISDFLKLINATNSLLYYEDIRIYRDYKNMTNRLNNCEQANTDRMIETANSQLQDIYVIEINDCIDLLQEKEQLVIFYRKKYEEASLSELSEIISIETNKKITKSGLAHRFTKIKQMANKLRNSSK